MKELVEEFEREYGEEAKELRSWKKKKKSLVGNYLASSWQNCYTDRGEKDTRKKERRDGRKIGNDRKIS